MDAPIHRLLDAFRKAGDGPPPDLTAFLERLPEPGALPSPWETWTLIGLVRHRERQLWVADIMRTRLRGDPSALAALGALGHPEGVEQSGSVPGMPEWEYYFHGRGCCLTHKVNGDAIDVDFWDDSAEYFDTYFYIWYLESLRCPEPAEQRLRELHRSLRPVGIAMKDLIAAGALTPLPGRDSHPPRVSAEVLACQDAIEALCRAWPLPGQRLWLAALIGDWPAAHEAAAGQPEVERITARRAEKCRQLRRERLLKETGYPAADALHGLAELGNAQECLEQAFRSPPSGLVSAALEIAGQENDPRWCPHIYALHSRVNPAGQIPEPHIWMRSLKFLLRHGYRTGELLAALAKAGGTELGEAVLLALEHAPEHALPLIRKGLLADIPINRTTVAAILVLIAKPWSTRELLRALEQSDDQEKTADSRAAILELGDAEAEKMVRAWEQKNPHEDEAGTYLEVNGRRLGPFYSIYSMGEHSLKNRGDWIRYEMDKLHDRVMKVRDVVPPESAGRRPWWKLWGG
jgi:hypothetical protein